MIIKASEAKAAIYKLEALKLRREHSRARWAEIFSAIRINVELDFRGCTIKNVISLHEEELLHRLGYHIRYYVAGQFNDRKDTMIAWDIHEPDWFIKNNTKKRTLDLSDFPGENFYGSVKK